MQLIFLMLVVVNGYAAQKRPDTQRKKHFKFSDIKKLCQKNRKRNVSDNDFEHVRLLPVKDFELVNVLEMSFDESEEVSIQYETQEPVLEDAQASDATSEQPWKFMTDPNKDHLYKSLSAMIDARNDKKIERVKDQIYFGSSRLHYREQILLKSNTMTSEKGSLRKRPSDTDVYALERSASESSWTSCDSDE